MILKTLIVTIILVTFVILALGIKMLFDRNAKFTVHSCSLENGEINNEGTCYQCQQRDPDSVHCPEIQKEGKSNY
jgi:hypothetical protein